MQCLNDKVVSARKVLNPTMPSDRSLMAIRPPTVLLERKQNGIRPEVPVPAYAS